LLDHFWNGGVPTKVMAKEKHWILQRNKQFKWEDNHLLRIWEDGGYNHKITTHTQLLSVLFKSSGLPNQNDMV
jgi:hypothetical protein